MHMQHIVGAQIFHECDSILRFPFYSVLTTFRSICRQQVVFEEFRVPTYCAVTAEKGKAPDSLLYWKRENLWAVLKLDI